MLEDVMLMQQTLTEKSNFKQEDKTKKKRASKIISFKITLLKEP